LEVHINKYKNTNTNMNDNIILIKDINMKYI